MGTDIPEQINNPDMEKLNSHLESLFGAPLEEIKNTLEPLARVLQDYIFFRTWNHKG